MAEKRKEKIIIKFGREKVLAVEMRLRSLVQYVKRKHLDLFPVWRHLAVPGVLMYDESQYVVDREELILKDYDFKGILFPSYLVNQIELASHFSLRKPR